MAALEPEGIPQVAGAWAEAEEFSGRARPEMLAQILARLRELAHKAQATDQRIYGWMCV